MHPRPFVMILIGIISLLATYGASAQSTWARNFGGGSGDFAYDVQTASDGGFVLAGETESFGAGLADAWILKMNSSGKIVWQKAYGTISYDGVRSLKQTSDGGYVATGYTSATNRVVWVIRLDSAGIIQWQKGYGGGNDDYASYVVQTSDGGFIVAGNSSSFGAGSQDGLVFKLNSFGSIQWQKAFGGTWNDNINSIQQTSDGGYIFIGSFRFGSASTTADIWVVKLDNSGNVQWQKTFGSDDFDTANAIRQTNDGGYIFAGVVGALVDPAIVKLDASGNVQWQKTYFGTNDEVATNIQQDSAGNYIVSGYTNSYGAGAFDFWILKLDNFGNILWQKSYGGTANEAAFSMDLTNDAGVILVGPTESYGQNLDVWQLKLNENGEISEDCALATDTLATASSLSLNQTIPAASANPAILTVMDTTVTPTDSFASTNEQCSGSTCMYCDDFEDGILESNWTYLKPAWNEAGGDLIATPTRKAIAVASPAFSGCGANCSFESSISTAGGVGNKIWMLAWYGDKENTIEVLMKEENDKFVIKQRVDGSIVAKTKAVTTILPNASYTVKVIFNGTTFVLFVNGIQIATLNAASPANGTIGFQAKNTTASFGHVLIE